MTDLTYPFAGKPDPATTMEVAPGIHWIRMPLPFALNHINLWLLEDGDAWTIVDTGLNDVTTKGLWQQLLTERLAGRPVRRMIVTHFHPDHAGLAGWLHETTGAPLWMSQAEWLHARIIQTDTGSEAVALLIAYYRNAGCDEDYLTHVERQGIAYAQRTTPLPRAYRRLRDNDTLTINGDSWQVIIGTGHAPEHACLYCTAKNLLISGDQVIPRISPNVGVYPWQPEDNPLADFLASSDALLALPPETLVLPSHNEPFLGLHPRLRQLTDHHEARLDDLLADMDRPKTAMQLARSLFRRPLDEHQMGFAIAETIAHLHLLRARDRIRRHQDDTGVNIYSRI
ncbi:MAG: MBL fold metallo-hydrolase [Alphaproteobacteria bacterium]